MRISETLQEQVEKFVIQFLCGDEEPLAKIWIKPMKKPNVDAEIKIDNHLISHGAKLSKADALARYGRTETTKADEDTALEPAATPEKQEVKK